MQKTKLSAFLLGTCLFMGACTTSTDNKVTDKTQPSTPPTTQPIAVKPELQLYMVKVDNLLLRNLPSKTGSQMVTKFASGDFVEGTGVVSEQKEEATIQNMVLIEPYIEVVSTTPEQKKGWAYGGALLPVYSGARNTTPDLGVLSQFSMALKGMNTKKLDSGKKAWDAATKSFSNASGALADAGFVMLQHFMMRLEMDGQFYNMTEAINWSDDDYKAMADDKFDMNKYPATKSLAENGFTTGMGEGQVFPITDFKKLHAFFALKCSPAFKIFLDQELLEFSNQAWDDGGIVVPLEQIADRAIFWEKFNQTNPYFLLKDRTQESERWTALVVHNGANNTQVYNYDTKEVMDDYKKLWAYVIQKYPGTALANSIKTLQDLYASEGWKLTPKVEAWIKDYTQKMYPEQQEAQQGN